MSPEKAHAYSTHKVRPAVFLFFLEFDRKFLSNFVTFSIDSFTIPAGSYNYEQLMTGLSQFNQLPVAVTAFPISLPLWRFPILPEWNFRNDIYFNFRMGSGDPLVQHAAVVGPIFGILWQCDIAINWTRRFEMNPSFNAWELKPWNPNGLTSGVMEFMNEFAQCFGLAPSAEDVGVMNNPHLSMNRNSLTAVPVYGTDAVMGLSSLYGIDNQRIRSLQVTQFSNTSGTPDFARIYDASSGTEVALVNPGVDPVYQAPRWKLEFGKTYDVEFTVENQSVEPTPVEIIYQLSGGRRSDGSWDTRGHSIDATDRIVNEDPSLPIILTEAAVNHPTTFRGRVTIPAYNSTERGITLKQGVYHLGITLDPNNRISDPVTRVDNVTYHVVQLGDIDYAGDCCGVDANGDRIPCNWAWIDNNTNQYCERMADCNASCFEMYPGTQVTIDDDAPTGLDGDQDGDGVPDSLDNCVSDPNSDQADQDGDHTGDVCDPCADDPAKTDAGICGCGIPDADTDGDGTLDCEDECPEDPAKTAAGVCGCGTPDEDSNGDGTMDCEDQCPNDPNKTEPGICGCDVADTDTDNDGTPDCNDQCVTDPYKTAPGICGCLRAETGDTDGDGTLDCNDGCPGDPAKVAPGVCGCGVAETDNDGDGTPECGAVDQCPTDPLKIEPGVCGCGTPDTDSDGDGSVDCIDACPSDGGKVAPGICGCGSPDVDSNGDGVLDCGLCPDGSSPNVCGSCGAAPDSDGDGTPDCLDNCPDDPNKVEPGQCGCGTAEGTCDPDGTGTDPDLW